MKVLCLNGSPREHSCTYTALREVADTLEKNGIKTEFAWVGNKPVAGCIACGKCAGKGRCIFDDKVNEILEHLDEYDGILVGSPVYYAGPSGQVQAFLDRLFYCGGARMKGKVGAAVVSCRRGGASAAFDRLNKYFTICGMPVVSSQYWNSVHGRLQGEAAQDAEGLQTMRTLARNMTFLIKSIALGKETYGLPEDEPAQRTNFIH